jgi:hypothetical protein
MKGPKLICKFYEIKCSVNELLKTPRNEVIDMLLACPQILPIIVYYGPSCSPMLNST